MRIRPTALFLPFAHRLDFSASQDATFTVRGAPHTVQFRVDIDNLTNLLNHDWGVGQRLVNNQPLTNPGVDAQGQSLYRMRVVNNALMDHSLETTASEADVYRIQFSFRYSFN